MPLIPLPWGLTINVNTFWISWAFWLWYIYIATVVGIVWVCMIFMVNVYIQNIHIYSKIPHVSHSQTTRSRLKQLMLYGWTNPENTYPILLCFCRKSVILQVFIDKSFSKFTESIRNFSNYSSFHWRSFSRLTEIFCN